jgi:serine/threonine protein kinase
MSKNDLFNESFTVTPPPSPGRSRAVSYAGSPFSPRPKLAPLDFGGSASDGSASSSRQQALASSSQVQLRVSASQIGSGRHATVFLASYRPTHEAGWQVCVAKRLSPDKEAQQAGINEACMLSRLSKCPQILRFLGLKDEQATDCIAGSSTESKSVPSSPVDGSSSTNFATLHSASSLRRAISVKQSRTPSRLSHSIEDTEDSEPTSVSLQKLYLVTEYCALGNLATFVQTHGSRHLGRCMFYKLALEMLQAMKYIHESNIIHADIKPHNFMVSWSYPQYSFI